jgi:hypothetical protein
VVDGFVKFAGGGVEARVRLGDLGHAGVEDVAVDAGEEEGVAHAGGGDAVTVGLGDASDEVVFEQSA